MICFISHSKAATAFLFILYKGKRRGESAILKANLRADVNLHSSSLESAAALMRLSKELPGKATHTVSYIALSPGVYFISAEIRIHALLSKTITPWKGFTGQFILVMGFPPLMSSEGQGNCQHT